MSAFWVAAVALTLAVVAALAVPLLRRTRVASAADRDRSNVDLFHDQVRELERDRDQGVLSPEQFEQARTELNQRLLTDVVPQAPADAAVTAEDSTGAWRYVALACVPISAVLAYLVLGTPEGLDPKVSARTDQAPADHEQNLGQLAERLAARLEANPQDAQAWVLLARSLQRLGRAPEAVKAFAKAVELVPRSAPLYADYADMQVAAANGQWTPGATEAVAKALEIDPAHPKSLWLAGTEAYARKDYKTALAFWEKLAPLTEPGSEVARVIQGNIAEVRSLMAGGGAAVASAPKPQASAAASSATSDAKPVAKAAGVTGTVALDPALAGKVKPSDTVFVFARAAQGPKMPLAIHRITVQDLPYKFALDDSAAMAPGMMISAFEHVVVGARVSRAGNATPTPGDFEGFSAPVKPGTGGIEVKINAQIQ